jgi:hypothetical protein
MLRQEYVKLADAVRHAAREEIRYGQGHTGG